VHVQVCRLYIPVGIILHIWKCALRRACTCACHSVCAVWSLALGNGGRGVQLVYAEHLSPCYFGEKEI